MHTGLLILRLVTGGLIAGHGLQKLRGWFDGPGLGGTEQMMSGLEMRPARRNAVAVAVTETASGAAIALGAATPAAAAGLTAVMLTAIRKVHWRNGVWVSGGGYEYNAVLIAVAAALTASGPGRISIDGALGKPHWGAGWALAALGAGTAASIAVVEAGRRGTEPSEVEDASARTDVDGAAGTSQSVTEAYAS
jgi:putative oxidoreductase